MTFQRTQLVTHAKQYNILEILVSMKIRPSEFKIMTSDTGILNLHKEMMHEKMEDEECEIRKNSTHGQLAKHKELFHNMTENK